NLEANEGATNTRMACFEILKKMLVNTQQLLEDGREATNVSRGIASLKLLKLMAPYSEESRQTKQLMDTAKLLNKCIHSYKIKVMDESCSVFGLEEDIHKLVLKLTDTNNNDNALIISIVGMRGIGKTTLAKIIYNHRYIINRFEERVLVSMRKEYYSDHNLLLKGVANQIMGTNEESSESQYWIEKIRNFLRVKRCLIVLDDLSSVEASDYLLKEVFECREMSKKGSKIVFTTRSKDVAVLSTSIHNLRLRTKEESWELFTQMIQCPADPEVKSLAEKVVARTGGLPLAILRLGYLLSGKKVSCDVLSRVLVRVSQGDQNKAPWIEIRDVNKSQYLRGQPSTDFDKCLSYFELFPWDFEIPVRRLVALWVAEGLVGETIHDERAYEFVYELIDRNMIQIVKKKNNGKVKTCRFPSILREVWLQNRRQDKNSLSWSLYTSFDRQVAYHFDDKEASHDGGTHGLDSETVSKHDGYPFSIVVFDNRQGSYPGKDIRSFLIKGIQSGRFQGLVVLDLEGVCGPNLSRALKKLKKLKYLGLRRTEIKTLPSSISQLVHLETLDLKHTHLEKVPSSIWKLKKLQRLYLDRSCRLHFKGIFMPNLQILSAFLDHGQGKNIALMNELHKLSNLRKLRLTLIQWTEPQQQQLATCLGKLTHLISLSLKSVDENMSPQELVLGNCLKELTNLSKLYLSGKLIKLNSNVTELPKSLVEVTLAKSKLSGPESLVLMRKLAKLPLLNLLHFRSNVCCVPKMVFPKKGFPQLLVMKLWDLDQLVELKVEEDTMQKLRELEIRCGKLEKTIGLTHLKNLQELKLTDIGEELGNESEDDSSTRQIFTVTSFWAPFLLLHLGGPDTITAYSLEDNELWWRNFVTLGGQLVAVLYIFLNAWSNNILNLLSIPILIAGLIKFGERIWALRCASSECFRKSMFPSAEAGPSYARHMDEYLSKKDEGFKVSIETTFEVPTIGHTHHHHLRTVIRPNSIVPNAHNLQHAHKFFTMFKPLFADLILSIHDIVHSQSFFQETSCDEVFRVIEIELGFMYDLFYTKALKFNSGLGCFTCLVTCGCVVSVSVFFLYIDKRHYYTVDIVITYILLIGAIVLEIYAVVLKLCSDWTMLWLSKLSSGAVVTYLYQAISFISSSTKQSKRWSNKVGQHNLISFCLKKSADKYWFSSYYDKLMFKYWYDRPSIAKNNKLKELIFEQLLTKSKRDSADCKELCDQRGEWVLKNEKCDNIFGWSVKGEFDKSILLWHIATDLCYDEDSESLDGDSRGECLLGELSKLMSEYMLYILDLRPFMLPNGIGQIRFQDTCAEATEFFKERRSIANEGRARGGLLRVSTEISPSKVKRGRSNTVLFEACRLAKELQKWESAEKKWSLINNVWVEILCYAANQCQGNHHAQQLRRGGELLTHVWLLMAHLGITKHFQIADDHEKGVKMSFY
ncbi:hypothetical protein G4B88_022455, partial [Cannabis sativa]